MRAELARFSRPRVSARQTQSRKLDYHLVVEGSCFDVSVDHIQLIGSSAVEPHVTCDHRQHKRHRDCTLNECKGSSRCSEHVPANAGTYAVLPSLALAAVDRVDASGMRPSGSVTDAGFSILYGADKLTVRTSAVVVASRAQIPMRYAARVVGLHTKVVTLFQSRAIVQLTRRRSTT